VKGELDDVQLVKGASAPASKTRKKSARKGSGGGVLEMAKEGQTISRLGSQLAFNGVQEVGVVSDGDLKGGRLQVSKRTDRRGWSMVERRTTKAGDSEGGLAYFPRLESKFEKKRVRASKKLPVEDSGNLLVGLARFSFLLAGASMSEFVHFKETDILHHNPSENLGSSLKG
jgi:hypothetical protein